MKEIHITVGLGIFGSSGSVKDAHEGIEICRTALVNAGYKVAAIQQAAPDILYVVANPPPPGEIETREDGEEAYVYKLVENP